MVGSPLDMQGRVDVLAGTKRLWLLRRMLGRNPVITDIDGTKERHYGSVYPVNKNADSGILRVLHMYAVTRKPKEMLRRPPTRKRQSYSTQRDFQKKFLWGAVGVL